jgi:protein-tyrosine phosphatase
MRFAVLATILLTLTAAAPSSDTRVLGLTGAPNFRDLGGYETSDGRHVRWGLVFRSDALSALTPDDEMKIDRLHIAAEIDLRTQQERAAEPDRWLDKPADIYESPRPSLAPIVGPMMAKVRDAATAHQWMKAFYARIPDDYRPEYAAIFHRLAAGREPLLIHCTAGKDRTGVASAILLSALGVPRETVVKDYLLTEALLPRPRAMAALGGLPEQAKIELWRTDDAYVLAALQSIDTEYGSVPAYLKNSLGLSEAEISQLRSRLIE